MPNTLLVTAKSWDGNRVASTFTVLADSKPLAPTTPGKPLYDIPAGTAAVVIEAKPTGAPALYHAKVVQLTVANSGTMLPHVDSRARVEITAVNGASSSITQASVKVSRFMEVNVAALTALTSGPDTSELAAFKTVYNGWPPTDWTLSSVPGAHYLDLVTPIVDRPNLGRVLNFKTDATPMPIDVEVVVLELAGVEAPKLFGVTWPKSVPRVAGADPTPMLLFFRQTGRQDTPQHFQGNYPYSFDYVERCLFESMHYGVTPLAQPVLFRARPKGVPYQVTKAGVNVVSVMPVTWTRDDRTYGVLKDMAETHRILAELQAFMFWRALVADPPTEIGRTAIAAFSSINRFFPAWLKAPANLRTDFLKSKLRAVYFLDPPTDSISNCLAAARAWAKGDQRYRFYTRVPEVRGGWNSHEAILGAKLPAAPYILNSADNRRTVTSLDEGVWAKTFEAVFGGTRPSFKWWDAHHFIVSTMLVHALSQGDFS